MRIPHLWGTDYVAAVGAAWFVVPAAFRTMLLVILRIIGFSQQGPVKGSLAARLSRLAASGGMSEAVLDWCQSKAATWPLFTPSAAVLGVVLGAYACVRYMEPDLRAIYHSGVWGGHDATHEHFPAQRVPVEAVEEGREEVADLIDMGVDAYQVTA